MAKYIANEKYCTNNSANNYIAKMIKNNRGEPDAQCENYNDKNYELNKAFYPILFIVIHSGYLISPMIIT